MIEYIKNNRVKSFKMFVILVMIIGFCIILGKCSGNMAFFIEDNANEYVLFKYPTAKNIRIVCGFRDTDENKYVTCEGAFEIEGISKSLAFECPTLYNFNKCKAIRGVFQSQ